MLRLLKLFVFVGGGHSRCILTPPPVSVSWTWEILNIIYGVQGAANWILDSPSRYLTETSCRMFIRHSISLDRFSTVGNLTWLPGNTL